MEVVHKWECTVYRMDETLCTKLQSFPSWLQTFNGLQYRS